jgi:hypothetical protein
MTIQKIMQIFSYISFSTFFVIQICLSYVHPKVILV